MVNNRGHVFSPIPIKTNTTCPVDVTFFPFDTQICSLQFISWTFTGKQLNLTIDEKDIDLKNYVPNGEWKLVNSWSELMKQTDFTTGDKFPEVRFSFRIKRHVLYFACHIIYPCVLLSAISLLVFWLPPDSGEKVGLGISVFLAYFVLMLTIAEKLPKTSESVPIISVYITLITCMSSISIILACVVLNLYYPEKDYQKTARVLGLLFPSSHGRAPGDATANLKLKRQTHLDRREESREGESMDPQLEKLVAQCWKSLRAYALIRSHLHGISLEASSESATMGSQEDVLLMHLAVKKSDMIRNLEQLSRGLNLVQVDLQQQKSIHVLLNALTQSNEDNCEKDERLIWWKSVAQKVDRIFLYIFSAFAFACVVGCFIIVPVSVAFTNAAVH